MFKKLTIAAVALGLSVAASAALAADKVSIVYIPKNTGNPYFDSLVQGFVEHGWKSSR